MNAISLGSKKSHSLGCTIIYKKNFIWIINKMFYCVNGFKTKR